MVESELAPPRHSALHGYTAQFAAGSSAASAVVRERPFQAMVDLRIGPDDHSGSREGADAVSRCADALGLTLPEHAGAASSNVERCVLWLGPRWWLVVGPPGTEAETAAVLRDALGTTPGAVTEVSCWRTTVEIGGPYARDLLRTGCSIDLHPRAFPPGSCAQTLLARAPVIIARLAPTSGNEVPTESDTTPVYQVFARTSYAAYLADWLLDAMTGLQRDLSR